MTTHQVPVVTLNNDVKIPQVGLGTWQMNGGARTEKAIQMALQAGYRMIDTAAVYGNEVSVGRAIKNSRLKREDIFVTTKLWNADQGPASDRAFEASLNRLGLDYVDLYLIHWPAPARDKYLESWQQLEKLYSDQKVRAIGVSNFKPRHLKKLLGSSRIVPALNQIETNPYYQDTETILFCERRGIKIASYSPFGGNGSSLLREEILEKIAKNHNVTPAQVVVRWHIQNGFILVPKASSRQHLKTNLDVFGFQLNSQDMDDIAGLQTGKKSLPDPDKFNYGIKTSLVQLAHKINLPKFYPKNK